MEQKILAQIAEAGRESADRRGFLKKAGKAAVVVPAVALLLSAQATPAEAFGRYGRKGGRGPRAKDRRRGHRHQRGRGHSLRRGRGHRDD